MPTEVQQPPTITPSPTDVKDHLAEPSIHRDRLGSVRPGRLRACGGVGGQVPPPHGLRQGLRKHEVQVQDRSARERAPGIRKQRPVQPLQVKRGEICGGGQAAGVRRGESGTRSPARSWPAPAGDVGEPVINVGAEPGRCFGWLGELHGSRMLAPRPRPIKRALGL